MSENNAYASTAEQNVPCDANAKPGQTARPQYEIGSYVTFGRYRQGISRKHKPIEWLVLDNNGDTALLFSKYALDCLPFCWQYEHLAWNSCHLRRWLNRKFLFRAFNKDEQQQIAMSKIFTPFSSKYHSTGGIETREKIFCLSVDEVEQYFDCADDRACVPTDFAVKRGVQVHGTCCYWLRSLGEYYYTASYINYDGYVVCNGTVSYADISVRPALRIKLG